MSTIRLRNRNQASLKHRFEAMGDNDVQTLKFDFSRLLGAATISSTSGTIRDMDGASSSGITTASSSNASGIAQITATAVEPGSYLAECQMTDSAGAIVTARGKIRVLEDRETY